MLNRKTFLTAALLGPCLTFGLAGFAQAQAQTEPVTVEAIGEGAQGFEVGSSTTDRVTYVFFDPQCTHCGALWEAAKPLVLQMKFVWIPVGLLNKRSVPQGAAILGASLPADAMDEHEASWAARKGGIYAPDTASGQFADTIAANTELFKSFGLNTVPFTATLNSAGQLITATGSRTTLALARLLELEYIEGQ